MILIRQNSIGLHYSLSTVFPDQTKTQITLVSKAVKEPVKRIIVDVPLEEMNRCWFMWQMAGKFVQDAFPKLNASEREFLMTGITPEEWAKTFSKEKK